MYHVHTSTLSSSTTTTEPVSTLSPSILFPFFQPSASPCPSSASPCTAGPHSSSSSYSAPHHTTTTSSTSSCACHNPHILPPAATAPPTFITLPSANPHQSVILPLPQPSPPPTAAAAAASSSSPAAPTTASPAASASLPSKSPLLVFSHGSTQVDTFVPSSACLQRTLYSWSQLSDYTTKYCWNLPAASSSTTQSSAAAGQPVGHNVSINNSNGRICQGDEVSSCPGHPWVNFSYHMQVKQWQEQKDNATAAAATSHHQQQQHSVPATVGQHMTDMGVKGLEVRVAAPSDILVEGVRRRRSHEQAQSDVDSDAGSMFDDVDGDDADEEDDSWNDLCSTTEDDEDEYELTDVDM